MKVVVFYQYFGTPNGGWSTRIYEMCQRWVAQGVDVTVVTSPYDKSDIKANQWVDNQMFDGIRVKIVNLPQSNKHPIWKRLLTFFGFSVMSLWFALTMKYDLAICSSGPITIGMPGLLAKWIRRKKVIFEVRDLWPSGAVELGIIKNKWVQKLAFSFEKTCYKSADMVVTCSSGMTQNIQQRFPKILVKTIPNASDFELFQKLASFQLPEKYINKKLILYTGSLGLMDDCGQIIEGIAAGSFPNDVSFVIIGEGTERIALMKRSKELNIDNIEFLGLIPKTQVIGWLHHAYAAMVTFKNLEVLQTSSPNKLFDAFAAGVPLIQNTQGWIKQLFDNYSCGLTVPQNNPEKFAEAITYLINHPDEREKMKNQCLYLAKNDFNRDHLALEYLNWMKGLAK